MRFGISAALALAGSATPAGVSAQQMAMAAAACPPGAVAVLPPELAGWATRVPLAAARDPAGVSGALLVPGVAASAALRPSPEIRYPAAPERPGGAATYGGLFGLTVSQAGSYRIALGAGAWIDMVGGSGVATSTGHGHGPDCSGIRKMVDFTLAPGRYTVQLAASPEATVPVMVVRLP